MIERSTAGLDTEPCRIFDISSRDLVHAAVALRLGVSRIISTDADFDRLPVVTRLAPERIDEWAEGLLA